MLGLGDAVLLGLGSILGTGVFVSLAIAAGVAGVWMLPALLLACGLAVCNGLSSAALAAAHPVSGGTYEYGYRYLHPLAGFTAGWTFLLAKTASAAAAALGGAGYLLALLGQDASLARPLALVLVIVMAGLVLSGMRRSATANAIIVVITLLALVTFVITGWASGRVTTAALEPLSTGNGFDWHDLLQATALLFVAYTGYARVATLGEEVREPRSTIPRAILLSLGIAALIYFGVATAGIGVLGADAFGATAGSGSTPLEQTARGMAVPILPALIAVGAVTAMLGVLLNLILGLSRTLLAMARRGDMTTVLAELTSTGNPRWAVVVVAAGVLALVSLGNIKLAWSFSAFNVLVYYAITNAAALRLPVAEGAANRVAASVGLAACLGLAFFVEPGVWLTGLALVGAGWLWFLSRQSRRRHASIPAG